MTKCRKSRFVTSLVMSRVLMRKLSFRQRSVINLRASLCPSSLECDENLARAPIKFNHEVQPSLPRSCCLVEALSR